MSKTFEASKRSRRRQKELGEFIGSAVYPELASGDQAKRTNVEDICGKTKVHTVGDKNIIHCYTLV